MKFKFNYLTILLTTILSFNLAAQKFGKPILGAGRSVMNTSFEGLLGEKEIRSNVTNGFYKYNYNLLIYENGKQLKKEGIVIKYNDEKYTPEGYFINNDKIIGYFIAGTKNTEVVKLCIQEFDTQLVQIGNPVELIELPKAVDPTKLLDAKSGGMMKDKVVKKQSLTAKFNPKTGTMLFSFSLQLTEAYKLSYAKIILVDKNNEVLNSYEYQASSSENYIKAVPLKIYENNDALVSMSEGKDERVDNVTTVFGIVEQFLMYVSDDGNAKELELMPDRPTIVKSASADQIDVNGNLIYAIQSYQSDNTGKVVPNKKSYIGIYTFNTKNNKLERISFEYDIDDLFGKAAPVWLNTYQINKIINLPDGSFLFWMASDNREDLFFKFDKNKAFLWSSKARTYVTGYSAFTTALDYFDESGNLNLIFNYHPKLFINNTFVKNKVGIADLGSIPIKAIIDIESGSVRYEKVNGGALKLGGIKMNDCINLGENGKFLLHMMIDKKFQFVEVDFTEN